MTKFAVTYTYSDDTGTRDRIRPAHRDYLGTLVEQNRLLVAGGLESEGSAGALLIFQSDDVVQVRSWVADDPFVQAGVTTSIDVTKWTPALGSVVDSFDVV